MPLDRFGQDDPREWLNRAHSLKNNGETLPPFLDEAVGLADFAVEARYPGTVEKVSELEYLQR
jgi:hypothetical protein